MIFTATPLAERRQARGLKLNYPEAVALISADRSLVGDGDEVKFGGGKTIRDGLKPHKDWGTTPAAISNCLNVEDLTDNQVAIHSDMLNESGFVENTIAATNDTQTTGNQRILKIGPR